MTLEAFWIEYGELLLFGALGGLIRWAVNKERWFDGLVGVMIGAIMALVFQPVAGDLLSGYVNLSPEAAGAKRCGAFLLGVAGVWPVQFYLDWARRRFEIRAAMPVTEGSER